MPRRMADVFETGMTIESLLESFLKRGESRMRSASRVEADGPMPDLTSRQARALKPRAQDGTRRRERQGRY